MCQYARSRRLDASQSLFGCSGEDKKNLAVTRIRIAIPRLCRPCLVTTLTEISRLLCYVEVYLLFTRHGDSVSTEPQAVRPHVFASLLHHCISFLAQLQMTIRTFHHRINPWPFEPIRLITRMSPVAEKVWRKRHEAGIKVHPS